MSIPLIDDVRKWLRPTDSGEDITLVPSLPEQNASTLPIAFVVDDEEGICKIIVMTLANMGVDARKFHTAQDAIGALDDGLPAIIFLDVQLQRSDAIDVIRGLGERSYRGIVQLMSGSNVDLLEDVRRVGARHGLNMRPPITKPFRTRSIRQIILDAQLADRPLTVGGLDEALANGWLELWYQPKIDLRKKTLAGAEGLIRARHPEHGVMQPASFLPGASESSQSALTEYVITTALRDWDEIAATGVRMQLAVNTSVGALASLRLPELIREHRSQNVNWPGLILEVTESEVVKDAQLMHEIATQLRICGITFAIDDFGEGFSSFARLRDIPFAELKLARSFVKDCNSDKRNASICQTIISLAHEFGAVAVAEGLDNAADLRAVHQMGCDIGQGYFLARPMPKDRLITLLKQRLSVKQESDA